MLDLHLDIDISFLAPMRFFQVARAELDASLPPASVSLSYHEDLIEARAIEMELKFYGCLDAPLP